MGIIHSTFLRWRIILFSLIIGIIYLLPHILFMIETKGNYKIIFAPEGEESEVYTTRIREAYDGNVYISDPYIYENKSKPYIRPFFPELVLGSLGKLFNLSIFQLLILSEFIFPVIIFLLIFCFLFLLSKSQNLSLLGSSFILLTDFPGIIFLLFKGLNIEPLFSKLINPTFNFAIFILCLIFTYKALQSTKSYYIFSGAIFLGLLFYCDPYYWSYIIASYFLLWIYIISKKNFIQFKALIFINMGGLIISIPYWLNVAKLVRLPYLSDVTMRFGLYHSHQPLLLKLPIIAILLFILCYRNRDFNFYFINSLLLGGFLCMNQQVISGKEWESWHWYLYIARHIAVIAGIVLLNNFLVNRGIFLQRIFKGFNYKRLKRLFLIFLSILLIVSGLYIQLSYYESSKEEQKKRQFLYDSFLWLNNNTKAESVVLSSNSVALILPVYTHNNVYTVLEIRESLVPDSEIMDRFLILACLFGMDRNEVITYIMNNRYMFFGIKPDDPKYKNIEEFFRLNGVFENVLKKYEYFNKQDMSNLLRRFRIDYILFTPDEQLILENRLKNEPFFNKVYDYRGIKIYRIIR